MLRFSGPSSVVSVVKAWGWLGARSPGCPWWSLPVGRNRLWPSHNKNQPRGSLMWLYKNGRVSVQISSALLRFWHMGTWQPIILKHAAMLVTAPMPRVFILSSLRLVLVPLSKIVQYVAVSGKSLSFVWFKMAFVPQSMSKTFGTPNLGTLSFSRCHATSRAGAEVNVCFISWKVWSNGFVHEMGSGISLAVSWIRGLLVPLMRGSSGGRNPGPPRGPWLVASQKYLERKIRTSSYFLKKHLWDFTPFFLQAK